MDHNDKKRPAPEPQRRTVPVFDADQPTENAGAPLHQGRRSSGAAAIGPKDTNARKPRPLGDTDVAGS